MADKRGGVEMKCSSLAFSRADAWLCGDLNGLHVLKAPFSSCRRVGLLVDDPAVQGVPAVDLVLSLVQPLTQACLPTRRSHSFGLLSDTV